MRRRLFRLVAAPLLLAGGAGAETAAAPPAASLAIRSRAIELGIAASLATVERQTQLRAELRGGTFAGLPRGSLDLEIGTAYLHVAELDRLDVHGLVAWQVRLGRAGAHPCLGILGGLREEWIGSFHEARGLLGLDLGVRFLVAPQAALRLDYRFVRVLDDPVADFNEQQILTGISLLLRNAGE